jgi:hypothetical protein
MNAGLTKALGLMMKSTPQIVDGLAALSIEQLQHRMFELAMKPDVMLHPLRPKSGWRNQNERLRILLNPGKIAQLCHPRWNKHPSACNRMLIDQNSQLEKTQMIEKERFGSPGKIQTCNPSVNSRTTNLIRTCRSWC